MDLETSTPVAAEVAISEPATENADIQAAPEGADGQLAETNPQETTDSPKQSSKVNAAMARLRRELDAEKSKRAAIEAEKAAELAKKERIISEYRKGVKASGLDGNDDDELTAKLNATHTGIPENDYKAERAKAWGKEDEVEKVKREKEQLERELTERKRKDAEEVFERDLKAIKAAHPEEKAETITDLSEDFFKLMKTGLFTAVEAYEKIRQTEAAKKPKAPPSTGSIKGEVNTSAERFTDRELDMLTEKQLKDPKILQKAIRSMYKT